MGAGRPRATTQHLELTGLSNIQATRYKSYNRKEGTLVSSIPKIPSGYTAQTKAAWSLVVEDLCNMGVLTQKDIPSLETAFSAYDEYVRAKKAIKKYDRQYSIEDTDYIKNRRLLSQWMISSLSEFNKTMARFGVMPTERSRLVMMADEEESTDPLEMILGN